MYFMYMYITLEKLHSIIQNITSPFILLGDMNAQMPHTVQLSSQWYKSKPYNNHSLLLCDLVCDYEMTIANFQHVQSVAFTYFKGSTRTYIDHVYISDQWGWFIFINEGSVWAIGDLG